MMTLLKELGESLKPGMTTLDVDDMAMELAERLRRVVADYDFALPVAKQITISLGVAELEAAETEIDFFQRADQLLYAAKSCGRNCVMMDA